MDQRPTYSTFARLAQRLALPLAVVLCCALPARGQETFEPYRADAVETLPFEPPAVGGPVFFQPPADGEALGESLTHPSADLPVAFPATTLSFGWLAPGGSEGFGSADFDVHRSWQWLVEGSDQPIIITPGFGMHFWSGPGVLDLPPRVYDVYLDLSWRMLNRDTWGLTGGITPGFYGDFERIDGDAFQFTGWLLGDWAITPEWTLLGGLAYVRQLKSNLLPVGGVVWRPNDDLRVEMVIPRPRIARRVRADMDSETWLYASGLFGGGAWAVDDGNENVLVQYNDLRLSLGVEWLRSNGSATTVELGYVFSREIAVNGFSVLSPDGTAVLQASTSF